MDGCKQRPNSAALKLRADESSDPCAYAEITEKNRKVTESDIRAGFLFGWHLCGMSTVSLSNG